MTTPLCERLGLDLPLFAFTRSPQVVAEVSRAGGLGVLGVIASPTEQMKADLDWIDAHVDGRPYGVDVVMPAGFVGADQGQAMPSADTLQAMLPEEHRTFLNTLLERHGVAPLPKGVTAHKAFEGWTDAVSRQQVNLALEHPIALIANALGPPPPDVIEQAHDHGVLVAALCGSKRHALRQKEAGVDILVAQGTEAGGHTGEISTFVLVPEIVQAVHPTPVLAAGGIGTGQQVAAALALGAQGAWTGSIWLTTEESRTTEAIRKKLVSAGSSDTVRSRSISGKPARQLVTDWSRAWDDPDNPKPLPMPLQFMLTAEATARIYQHAERTGEADLLTSPVGQIVGTMNSIRPVRNVVDQIRNELHQTLGKLAEVSVSPCSKESS